MGRNVLIRRYIGVALVAMTVFVSACGDDDPVAPKADPTPYRNLTQPEHVLQNLELAYNQRNIAEFQKFIDDHFVFYFSASDVSGGTVPESWGYDEEVIATRNMFDPSYAGPNPISSISLSLSLQNVQWDPVTSDDPAYPGETWYAAVVAYDYTIQALPDITFVVTDNPKVQYFVRQSVDNGVTKWRLVRWRDLSGTTLRASSLGSSVLSTEETTWGRMKSLYN